MTVKELGWANHEKGEDEMERERYDTCIMNLFGTLESYVSVTCMKMCESDCARAAEKCACDR